MKPQLALPIIMFNYRNIVLFLLLASSVGAAAKDLRRELESPPQISIDFEGFSAGDDVSDSDLGYGVSVSARKLLRGKQSLRNAKAMIFDSSNPTGGDFDLGTRK